MEWNKSRNGSLIISILLSLDKWSNKDHQTSRRDAVVSFPATYTGGRRFKSRAGSRLF